MNGADVQQGITVDLVSQYRLDMRRIYAAYSAMGGMNTEAEVGRYLAGSSGLLQLQRDLVAHAVNEELNDPYPRAGSMRAPYSSASVALASGYAASELDGDRFVSHQRPQPAGPSPKDARMDRVASLHASGLLDRPPTGYLERLPRMARAHFDVMGAAATLITEDEMVTKSSVGTWEAAMPLEHTFCNQTIRFNRTLVIPDTQEDPRFRDNPFVTGPPFIRFYAGHPIQGPGDIRIGALCIVDDRPRGFSDGDERKLRTLAALVQLEIWAPHQTRVRP